MRLAEGRLTMRKPYDVSLKRLAWPKHRETVNGFRSKQEVETQMKNLTAGLKALRVWTENMSSISFHPEDIISFNVKRPTWRFDKSYPPNGRLMCYVRQGTRLVLRLEADQRDRFDDGPDCRIGGRECDLFERLIHFPDIVDMDFIYDEDYWESRKKHEPYEGLVETRRYITVCVPYSRNWTTLENDSQKAWIDRRGYLNIMWSRMHI